MGQNTHPTSQPNGVSMDKKRERMTKDLESLAEVESVRDCAVSRNTVVFKTKGTYITADILRVLANHDAYIPSMQPESRHAHEASIHMP